MKNLNLLVFLCLCTSLYAQSNDMTKYYRHLRYNHVSPYLELAGTYPIDKNTAETTSHYIFKYDDSNRLTEIINHHYHTEKQHPLASIGVYKLTIEYTKNHSIRRFYDKNGKRIMNDRAVYKEVYYFDKKFNYKMAFFDLENQAMLSNWGIAEYHWKKNKNLIIENRYDLNNDPVALSPYFRFGTTGILLYKNGFPKAHYNLDDKLNVIANEKGTASYQDVYDAKGNHATYSYHDANDDLVTNQWGFAYGEKIYDATGHQIGLKQFDIDGNEIRNRPIYTNTTIELAKKASSMDSMKIVEKSIGYLFALQKLKPKLMNEVMNDSLNKVTIGYDRDTKKEYARATTKSQMLEYATSWNKGNNRFPTSPNNQIEILDIYNRIATVKLVSDNWVEYLHLIKLDGKWTIENLIWQYKDINRYPKD